MREEEGRVVCRLARVKRLKVKALQVLSNNLTMSHSSCILGLLLKGGWTTPRLALRQNGRARSPLGKLWRAKRDLAEFNKGR